MTTIQQGHQLHEINYIIKNYHQEQEEKKNLTILITEEELHIHIQ